MLRNSQLVKIMRRCTENACFIGQLASLEAGVRRNGIQQGKVCEGQRIVSHETIAAILEVGRLSSLSNQARFWHQRW
jgi:hypothetical protein